MRRIFVGDIQGCRAELEDLLAAVEFDPSTDVLHPAGDMVRKGPDDAGVLELLIDVDAQPVLGNHDLRYLENREWQDPRHEAWLRRQPLIRQMPDIIMVHAGIHPNWRQADLDQLSTESDPSTIRFAVTARYCDADGNLAPTDWPPPDDPYRPWHAFYRGPRRVVFGHWARQGLLRTDHVLGLDTGCVYGKELTAWIAEEDRIVQVPARQ